MIAKRIVPVILAVGMAAVGALSTTMANAADTGKHQATNQTTHSQPQYRIDQPRDPYTQGARFDVSPADQGRFIRTGQDLSGVSAPPGNTPA